MAVIKVGGSARPDPDIVELFDHKFTVKRITRSVQKALEAVDRKLNAMDKSDEDDSDKVVAVMAEGLSALLEPNGENVPAKKVLVDAWKADDLSFDEVQGLYVSLQEAATERRPPISRSET